MLPRRSLAGLAVVIAAAGCGGSRTEGCTAIGCVNQVTVVVDQPGERPLEACVGAACSPPGGPLVVQPASLGETVEVVVRVVGGVEVARASTSTQELTPNGPQCPPRCRSARLRLTVDDRLVPT